MVYRCLSGYYASRSFLQQMFGRNRNETDLQRTQILQVTPIVPDDGNQSFNATELGGIKEGSETSSDWCY